MIDILISYYNSGQQWFFNKIDGFHGQLIEYFIFRLADQPNTQKRNSKKNHVADHDCYRF